MSEPIGIALLGAGTVGSGVANLLHQERELLRRRVGAELKIVAVCDKKFPNADALPESLKGAHLHKELHDAIKDHKVKIVIELIGGKTVAREAVLAAIAAGKPTVTANKALLATHAEEIFGLAESRSAPIGFEASVAGGIPVLRAIREGLSGDRILSVRGIINGTSNYILSEMTDKGEGFSGVLKKAQQAGYAEADPTFDVEGVDAAHKLALLASMCFGTHVPFDQIYTEGITKITAEDIAHAKSFGYRIKLLGIARLQDGEMELRVHPVMIREETLLAKISGALNGVAVEGAHTGVTHYTGWGAGGDPTAGAIVSDLVAIARYLMSGGTLAPARILKEANLARIPVRPVSKIESAYYLRFSVRDRPGVLAKLAGHLGSAGVSIAQIHQPLRSEAEGVPVIVLTHRTREELVQKALPVVAKEDFLTAATVLVRVEDERL
ncbi:MAG: homoserine dehydrogenase [Bdellovibrionota bacterium]